MSQMPVTQNAAAQLAIFANPDALETVREIMSSEDFSASDLDRIKVPVTAARSGALSCSPR